MSESTLAIDHAWSVVKGDPDKIEKIAPLALAAPAVFGALGAATGSGARLGYIDEETGMPVFDPGFHADAGVYDPITGGYQIAELGDSTGDRLLGGATGALQAINPLAYVGRAGIKAAGKGVRTADKFADTVRVADGVTDITRTPMQTIGQGAGRGIEGVGRGMQRVAASKGARGLGRLGQLAGNTYQQIGSEAAALAAGFGAKGLAGLGGQDSNTGFGQQYDAFGSGGLGVNDISNVQGNAVADRQIWNPEAYRGQERVDNFEGTGTAGGGEFGGFGIGKGDIMFVNRTGNEIKKQVEEMMYKAKCPECGKEDCIGKMHCGTMKAECPKCGKDCKCDRAEKADDKKKPAHGMVIVIGSKAGPGPSKDGKREKLDSEKKEE